MSKPSLCDLTATEASKRIRAGELTSVAYVESCLERIKTREPEVEAWVHLDPEQAEKLLEWTHDSIVHE